MGLVVVVDDDDVDDDDDDCEYDDDGYDGRCRIDPLLSGRLFLLVPQPAGQG
jgi:hypothetical protein